MPGQPKTKLRELQALLEKAEAIYYKVHDLMPKQYRDARVAARYEVGGWWRDALSETIGAHSALGDLIEAIEDHSERNRPACAEAKVEAAEMDNANGKLVETGGYRTTSRRVSSSAVRYHRPR